ncbi:MAG: hypothetical protein R3309_01425 [Reinekea sp.]|nr:hypothetical protein [Reinekea sp.]
MDRLLGVAAAGVTILLSGCNPLLESTDDSNTEETVTLSTGEFLAFDISGLPYTTESQQGTITNSQYSYQAGETVTVSVLGEQLASFSADTGYALTDLASEYPQSTDDFLNFFFDNQGFSDFTALTNLIQLLATLDADADPSNGFDVSAFSTVTTINTELDFSVAPYDFYEYTLIQLTGELGIDRKVTPMVLVPQLYAVAGLELPYVFMSNQVQYQGLEMTLSDSTVYEYSASGYLEREATSDEQSVLTSDVQYEADDMGRLLSERYINYDAEGNKSFERGSVYTYNASGQKVGMQEYYDYNGDGTYNSSIIMTFAYDPQGRVSGYTQVAGSNYTYRTSEYDSENRLVTEHEWRDVNDDQQADQIIDTTYLYDSTGQPLEKRAGTDTDADGVYDSYNVEAWQYNERSDVTVHTITTYDTNEVAGYSYVETYTFDEQGNRTEYRMTTDYEGDQTIDYLTVQAYTVNEDGDTTEMLQSVYNDGVTLSKVYRTVFSQPDLGYLGNLTKYTDSNGDGSYESSQSTEYQYDNEGRIEQKQHTYDTNNDGVTDNARKYVNEYEHIDDGVGAVLFEFFAFWL